ncbi:TetR/AcrR family transcriptional regulator [Pseudomonas phytophila]|uniref:TetR/AcrR family transcriptional regulator n=1 Tax=Pseudomonas phytophila TaxID=2867264 RepID=A0ABY6FL38_9PSED|nr:MULTISPECIES: TetR/AcrR family transcriptional regulator [Pseudomonas]MCQ2998181.1 TetR/AcrR family transcriptional regulator [Pseudomonas syringae]MCD5978080.1 TetR/AcrR family transcriptional regulator [Pseudomonas quasicaspiana]MCD5990033.1 TetR/AcrR family transcriptional regulator [Pseudomonas quasicaspiana]PHN25188.1 TetR family transcriptional regulator [Pseudomonas sp. ICMP 561]UXZ98271.1 TetR/AcrR family transcriptional regulator [Pseudomonas phytophila]
MKKPNHDMRQHILDVARSLMTNKGYTAVGLAEVVSAAGVPKGSFYYYFKSKEEFGEALLEEYFSEYLGRVDALMALPGNGAERLWAYFNYWKETQGTDLPDGKCLVVKLGPEVCDLSDGMRKVLERGTAKIIQRITTCVDLGIADDSLHPGEDSRAFAEGLYQLWLGASLLVKVNKSTDSFDTALNMSKRLLR